jgi:predicted enzyme related to lactoylglutathione lyase
LVNQPARFAWYELLTTDVAAASAFYGKVVGWGATDASTPELAYTILAAGEVPVAGLWISRKRDGDWEQRRDGSATSQSMTSMRRPHRSGVAEGAVLLPPTDSNIGRVSVVADPQKATFALVSGLTYGPQQPGGLDELGRVGWHELLAQDRTRIFDFYGELFGWQKDSGETDPADFYQLFSSAGQTIGGMLTKLPSVPQPCWLYYFNVDDIGAAAERVNDGGGRMPPGSDRID